MTSIFKLPISPVQTKRQLIDELKDLSTCILEAPLDSIDWDNHGNVTIDGKYMMGFKRKHSLHIVWEEKEKK